MPYVRGDEYMAVSIRSGGREPRHGPRDDRYWRPRQDPLFSGMNEVENYEQIFGKKKRDGGYRHWKTNPQTGKLELVREEK